jgi:hypothetical protein
MDDIPFPPPPHIKPGSIPFTQYLMPDGREKQVWWEPTSPEEAARARELLDQGALFTSELLQTGEASFTIELEDEILASAIAPNGPEVVKAVSDMITEAHDAL